jgi:hypothetical protein
MLVSLSLWISCIVSIIKKNSKFKYNEFFGNLLSCYIGRTYLRII